MPNTIVFIDGKYLQLIMQHFSTPTEKLKIDFVQLCNTISKKNNLWCNGIYYYTAPPFQNSIPNDDMILRRSSYDKFTKKLRDKGVNVREGRCQKVDGEYKQKGVDTLITMDLLTMAAQYRGSTFILLACDTDFVPILNEIRTKFGIKILLYYYNDFIRHSQFAMSNYLFTVADEKILITKELLAQHKID